MSRARGAKAGGHVGEGAVSMAARAAALDEVDGGDVTVACKRGSEGTTGTTVATVAAATQVAERLVCSRRWAASARAVALLWLGGVGTYRWGSPQAGTRTRWLF